jgi:hypothetical protein
MYYIVHFLIDGQYAMVDPCVVQLEKLPDHENYDTGYWLSLSHSEGEPYKGKCLYDDQVFDCALVHVASDEQSGAAVLHRIRRIVTEKKSSLSSICRFISLTSKRRTNVPPMSQICTSDEDKKNDLKRKNITSSGGKWLI